MTAVAADPITLGRQVRQQIVQEVTRTVGGATAVFVCRVHKIPVSELERLRRSLGAVCAGLTVVKNALGRRAVTEAGFTSLKGAFEGTSVLGVTRADPVACSKVLVTFAKEHEGFTVRGAVVEGQPLLVEGIRALAALPSREVLLAKLVGGLQQPIAGFIGVLSGLTRRMVYVLEAVRQSKGSKTDSL